jgi:hypothetical protein
MPSTAIASAWALQQIRFLTVRGPIFRGEKRVGKGVVITGILRGPGSGKDRIQNPRIIKP